MNEKSPWQKIDSCPKNVRVLIGGGGCPFVQVNNLESTGSQSTPFAFRGLGTMEQPTHWMPIPDAPNEA
jgi:hypothetical protein